MHPPPVSQKIGGTLEIRASSDAMVMAYIKPSPPRTPPLKPYSKPRSRIQQELEPQSEAHAETLTRHRIKVRDFAYESKLPPIRSWHKRQIQPNPPSLSVWETWEESLRSTGLPTKKPKLRRQSTEPDIQNTCKSAPVPVRDQGFISIFDYGVEQPSPSFNDYSQQSSSRQPSESVQTPAQGSFHWAFSGSGFSSIPRRNAGSESPLSFENISPALRPLKDQTGLVGDLSPMSSLSSVISDPSPSPLPSPKRRKRSTSISQDSKLKTTALHKPTPAGPSSGKTPLHTSRYYLRKRPPEKPLSQTTTTRWNRALPIPLRPAHSIQSSHSRTKRRRMESIPPRPRLLRKRLPSSRKAVAASPSS